MHPSLRALLVNELSISLQQKRTTAGPLNTLQMDWGLDMTQQKWHHHTFELDWVCHSVM